MKKQTFFWWLVSAVALSLVVNIFFGRQLTAEISTFPILNKWKILSPQAPIVINTKEVVDTTDSGDILSSVNDDESKISTVVGVHGGKTAVLGGAVNLTGDGLFLAPKTILDSYSPSEIRVALDNGQVGNVLGLTQATSTGLVVIKTDLSNVAVAALGDSSALNPGDRLICLFSGTENYQPVFQENFVGSPQSEVFGKIFSSDFPGRSFSMQTPDSLPPGSAIFDSNDELVGIWDGHDIISSDVLTDEQSLLISGGAYPAFGFSYQYVTGLENQVLSLPRGAEVENIAGQPAVAKGSPAAEAGLQAGDIITQVDGQDISEASPIEPILQSHKPGDTVGLTVVRGKVTLNLKLTVGPLK